MIDPKVLFQAEVTPSIVALPATGVDEAVGDHFAADDGLQRGFGSIGHDFCIDTIASLEQTKDDGFTACATPAFAVNTFGAKVGTYQPQAHRRRKTERHTSELARISHTLTVRSPLARFFLHASP